MTSSSSQILHKTLSSRPSSQSSANWDAAPTNQPHDDALSTGHLPHPLRVIGRGSCGTIFAGPGSEIVYKKGTDTKALRNDFLLTNHIGAAMLEAKSYLQAQAVGKTTTFPRIPRCHEFLLDGEQTKQWWKNNKCQFPFNPDYESDNQRAPMFSLDRIPPIPSPARRALIEAFFDDEDVEDALADDSNDACLVRIYLGQREPNRFYDSLLNFELHLERMRELRLDAHDLATQIALGLAVAHWHAQIDCRDTEFVLGGAEEEEGTTHLWMLDFDKARSFELDDGDVIDKLKAATMGNDPYFPDPVADDADDRELWNVFKDVY